jgi:hypothetical protein
LIEKDNKVTEGKLYILNPNYPHDLSQGMGYCLNKLKQTDKVIKCDVCVIDESSKTKERVMHLEITLKDTFKGNKVQAEIREEGNAQSQPIIFKIINPD